ncbi:MAG: hypothetical protein JXL97_08640 [Bacteroidales bacterium]|nr:hypothetical protein [Bacteroidales bacterium]
MATYRNILIILILFIFACCSKTYMYQDGWDTGHETIFLKINKNKYQMIFEPSYYGGFCKNGRYETINDTIYFYPSNPTPKKFAEICEYYDENLINKSKFELELKEPIEDYNFYYVFANDSILTLYGKTFIYNYNFKNEPVIITSNLSSIKTIRVHSIFISQSYNVLSDSSNYFKIYLSDTKDITYDCDYAVLKEDSIFFQLSMTGYTTNKYAIKKSGIFDFRPKFYGLKRKCRNKNN